MGRYLSRIEIHLPARYNGKICQRDESATAIYGRRISVIVDNCGVDWWGLWGTSVRGRTTGVNTTPANFGDPVYDVDALC